MSAPGFWDALAPVLRDAAIHRPQLGQMTKVYRGKHRGVVGRIVWHGRDKYSDAFRYGGEASLHLRDVLGRSGFRVGIEPNDALGTRIYTRADYIVTAVEGES